MIGDSDDEINLPHKLLLTNTQVGRIRTAFANGSSANTTFSKIQLSKMMQLGGFGPVDLLGNLLDLTRFFVKLRGSGLTLTNNEIK